MIETPLEALQEAGLYEGEAKRVMDVLATYGYIITRVSDASLKPFRKHFEERG